MNVSAPNLATVPLLKLPRHEHPRHPDGLGEEFDPDAFVIETANTMLAAQSSAYSHLSIVHP